MSKSKFLILMLGMLVLAASLRLAFVWQTPYDWDEPVYASITQGILERGYPNLTFTEGQPEFYSYNPPQHFYLQSVWFAIFGETIEAGRIFSTLNAVGLIALVMLWISQSYDKKTALLVGGLLAVDGWFTYSSLLVKLDVSSMLYGVLGLYLFNQALESRNQNTAIWAGLAIGVAATYKHVAVIFALAILFNFLLTRKNWKLHQVTLLTVGFVVFIYVSLMVAFVGDPYVEATTVQIRRSLGIQESRGLNYGWLEAGEALFQTYWAFFGTVMVLVFAAYQTLVGSVPILRGLRSKNSLVTAWMLAALAVLAFVRLRNPHYLVHLVVPAIIIFSSWFFTTRNRLVNRLLVVVVVLNVVSLSVRATDFSTTNALEDIDSLLESYDRNLVIVSEEPICALAEQECYKIGTTQNQGKLETVRPDLIVTYSSTTQQPPQSQALMSVIADSTVIAQFTGWKEVITVFEVPPGYWGEEK